MVSLYSVMGAGPLCVGIHEWWSRFLLWSSTFANYRVSCELRVMEEEMQAKVRVICSEPRSAVSVYIAAVVKGLVYLKSVGS